MVKRSKAATIQLKVRMKEPMRAKIERAAEYRGISMSAEIVSRLEDTFENRDVSFGGSDRYQLMRLFAISMGVVEQKTGKSWLEDTETRDQVKIAFSLLLNMFGPQSEPNFQEGIDDQKSHGIGGDVVKSIADWLAKRRKEQ